MMQKKVLVSFESSWILSKKDDAQLPVEAFAACVQKALNAKILDTSLTDCEFILSGDDLTEEAVKQQVEDLLKQQFAITSVAGVAECTVSDYTPAVTQTNPNAAIKPEAAPEEMDSGKLDAVVNRTSSLIGADEFKCLAEECVKIAPGLLKHNTVEAFTHRCYLFSVNEGNGLTTYLELFAELLSVLKLFSFADKNRVVEEKLLPPQAKDTGNNPFGAVYSQMQRYGANAGKIICIDISEWMTKLTEKEFREFLSNIDDNMGRHIYVFKAPFVEKEILNGMKRAIGDVLFVRDVSFVPFDYNELTQYAENALHTRGYSMEQDAWDVFQARINEEKSDGRFYGINTVNKILREMLYRKQLYNAADGVDDQIVKKAEILDLAHSYADHEKTGMEMLDDYIGMESIKKRVEEIVGQIELAAKNNSLGSPCIHMRFVGNPGTGKTTVARVVGKILKEKGILRNGNFFEYSGRDFCGRYVGETAPKTAAMCRDAYGSVLFIDEAYALYRGDGFSKADYGREAIDTLIAEMENHRSDLVVIMAGYPREMNDLMRANAGLESRMPYVVEFPNYTREQLFQIFMLMADKSFPYREGFGEAVKSYFDNLPEEVIQSEDFSNARFVRNLFERTWGKAVLRSQINKENAIVLIKEDFLLASGEKEFNKIMKKPSRSLGFL